MEDQLAAQGFSELDVYEKLAQSKAYRQLRRGEVVFQQMWLRVHRHLERLAQSTTEKHRRRNTRTPWAEPALLLRLWR